MNADLHMAGELKNTGKGNLFVVFGEPDIDVQETEDGCMKVKINGVDVFHPATGEIRSDDADGIACWFVDTDYNEESFFVRHAYFSRRQRPIQGAQDHPESRNRRRRLGDAAQRHVATVRQACIRPHRREGSSTIWGMR